MSADDQPSSEQPPIRGWAARYYWLPSLLAVAIVSLAFYARYHAKQEEEALRPKLFQRTVVGVMGSGCHVTFVIPRDLAGTPQECFDAALSATKRAEKLLSFYDPQSDVSRVNTAPAGTLVSVDPLTWQTLMEALRFCYVSGGAFDPATGSITRLYKWGNREEKALPKWEDIDRAKAAAGEGNLLLEREGMRVGRKNAETILDLGGLAQGLGTDIFMRALYERGVRNAVVEIGGEVKVLGRRPHLPEEAGGAKGKSRLWNVGMRDPRDPNEIRKLAVRPNYAVSTSGDYEKFFEFKGKRYSHIVDPKTGLPINGGIISATIIAPRSCMRADALATIACVLGEKKFRSLLKKDFPTVEAYLMDEKRELIHIEPAEAAAGAYLAENDEDVEEDAGEDEAAGTDDTESTDNYWPVDAGYQRSVAPPQSGASKSPALSAPAGQTKPSDSRPAPTPPAQAGTIIPQNAKILPQEQQPQHSPVAPSDPATPAAPAATPPVPATKSSGGSDAAGN